MTIVFAATWLIGLSVSGPAPAASASQDPSPPQLSFSDLKRNDSITGPFIVVGFVIQTYKCPPCPPNAMCKPCLGDHLVITENVDEKDQASIQHLRIFTNKPEQFELRKKYSFTVRPRGKTLPGHPMEAVNLISFEPLKE